MQLYTSSDGITVAYPSPFLAKPNAKPARTANASCSSDPDTGESKCSTSPQKIKHTKKSNFRKYHRQQGKLRSSSGTL
ncbi:hypothetical protein HYQ46_009688 [Verticillium longisporum]|nr:hypothetical protein HYQ46_009688 [Verticillium longisporum]